MKPSKTQDDRNLDFNGQAGGVSYKELSQYRGNQHKDGFRNPDMINQGRRSASLRGNNTEKTAGPVTAKDSANNVESGKRSWRPSATENYVGNYDKINMGNPITRGNPR